MDEFDVEFCFYDDPDYAGDADRDSNLLRAQHSHLWSKELPSGDQLQWLPEPGTRCLTCATPRGDLRVSSDTIATTHASYTRFGMDALWAGLSKAEQDRYDRAFYRIGGFIVFPVHGRSLNQVRGSDHRIADRFDLTLECIRLHYLDRRESPLAAVLEVDADFFGLFGEGATGFAAYVDFFHLGDLVSDGSIRWLDDHSADEWDFSRLPLPQSAAAYRAYLDNVTAFVDARTARIGRWIAEWNGV
jgi:hypothetical protein